LSGRARVNLSGRRERRLAHRLSVPLLAAPASPFAIDDASSTATAARVIAHEELLFLRVIKLNLSLVIERFSLGSWGHCRTPTDADCGTDDSRCNGLFINIGHIKTTINSFSMEGWVGKIHRIHRSG
jgi:hypothetical protein